ncbi:MAG TPA: copper-binding protein [Candidatus Polarisedimenticolia bacterium]|nr:copper-binding protein [Candidatus Polarisedimenticolia bacterium]
MKKMLVLSMAALFVLGVASFALAAEKKAGEQHHRAIGEVVKIDATARTITIKETVKGGEAKEMTFTLAEKAKVMVHGKPGTLDELKEGDSVTVKYEKKDGADIAEELSVAKPPAKKA